MRVDGWWKHFHWLLAPFGNSWRHMRSWSRLGKLLFSSQLLVPILEVCAVNRDKAVTIGFPRCQKKELAKDAEVSIASDLAAQLSNSVKGNLGSDSYFSYINCFRTLPASWLCEAYGTAFLEFDWKKTLGYGSWASWLPQVKNAISCLRYCGKGVHASSSLSCACNFRCVAERKDTLATVCLLASQWLKQGELASAYRKTMQALSLSSQAVVLVLFSQCQHSFVLRKLRGSRCTRKAVLLVLKLLDIRSLATCSLLLVQESHAEQKYGGAQPYFLHIIWYCL